MTSDNDRQTEMRILLLEATRSLIASVEAGHGLDHALYQYSQCADNELARAFAGVLDDVRSGMQRRAAVRQMAQRLGTAEVTDFVEALIRADEEGLSILEALKAQASQLERPVGG